MSNTPSLDIAIGIVFVVMLLSLVVTGIQEIISHLLDTRFQGLKDGLDALLHQNSAGPIATETIINHPVIRALSKVDTPRPSYIPTQAFVQAFVGRLVERAGVDLATWNRAGAKAGDLLASLPEGNLKTSLFAISEQGHASIADFETHLASHFDATMARVGGWYKRRCSGWLFGLGLFAAVGLNADMVMMARHLAQDAHARTQLAAAASAMAEAESAPTLDSALEATKDLPLPIGWHFGSTEAGPGVGSLLRLHAVPACTGDGALKAWLSKFIGVLLTAAAVGLGAPFWFDVLGRLTSFRATTKMGPKKVE